MYVPEFDGGVILLIVPYFFVPNMCPNYSCNFLIILDGESDVQECEGA